MTVADPTPRDVAEGDISSGQTSGTASRCSHRAWDEFAVDTPTRRRYTGDPFVYLEQLRAFRQTRMANQEALGAQEQVLHAVPCGCLVLDPQGQIRFANARALRLLWKDDGTTPVLGQPLLDAAPFWQHSTLAHALPAFLNGHPQDRTAEFELRGPGDRWLSVCISPLAPKDHGILLTILDTTELVQLRQRLRWSEYQASIGKLARGIAHELNNPLDGVLRYTHLALEQLTDDSPLHEYLVHVKEGLDRMVKAVKAFLEFSRQASLPVTRKANLNQLVEDALLLVRHRVSFQQIRIMKDLDQDLPAVLDAGLQHAVVNVIKNAIEAMPRGGTLRIQTRHANGTVELEVEDTGCGISRAVQGRLFEAFVSTKPIHQGTGLGLAIAKEVVERSGGQLAFVSQEGVGTTFRMEFPMAHSAGTPHG